MKKSFKLSLMVILLMPTITFANPVSAKNINLKQYIHTSVYLCENSKCQNHDVSIYIPIKEKYANRNMMKELIARYINEARQHVHKRNKNNEQIEMEIKGQLYRNIDKIDRVMKDKVLEKYLIDVNIQ